MHSLCVVKVVCVNIGECFVMVATPLFQWFPSFHRIGYHKFWKMHGFWFNWLGRQVFVSFGKDVHGLYERH